MTNYISILIPVYNNLKYTSTCLKELYEMISALKKHGSVNIIVSDDGSTDGTSEWISENYPQIILLKGNGNLWWSGGMNLAIDHAINKLNSDYVLWWNNDIRPAKDYLQNLIDIIENYNVKVGGSKIYYADQTDLIWSMGGIFNTDNGKKYMIGMNELDSSKYSEPIEVDWLPGMGTFIHKSVFNDIGFIDDKNFPQYHGDSDFTYRARLAGYIPIVFPSLKIWNDKSNSGLLHQDNYKTLIRSLNDIKSNYHIQKDIQFYKRYATSPMAYQTLIHKYGYYIGGFIKWKMLNLIGISKKRSL